MTDLTVGDYEINDETDLVVYDSNDNLVGYWDVSASTWVFDAAKVSASPTATDDVVRKDYVDSLSQGNDWQESVIDEQNDPPSSPSDGDRYLVGESPTGDWSGEAEEIAEWDADTSQWVFSDPDEGTVVQNEATDEYLRWNTTDWVSFGSAFHHGSLTGLGDDDHPQYLLDDGTDSMSGALDMGSNAITNATTVNSNTTDTNEVQNQDYNESVNSIANASGTTDIDLSAANMVEIEADGDITITFSNVTSTPLGNSLLVRVYDDDASGPHTITWPASVEWDNGNTRDTVDSDGELEISLRSYDGGTTWKASRSGRDFS